MGTKSVPTLPIATRPRRRASLNFIALLLAIAGAVVAVFYGLESYLSFQASGFTATLLFKLLICAVGAHFCWRNAKRVRKAS